MTVARLAALLVIGALALAAPVLAQDQAPLVEDSTDLTAEPSLEAPEGEEWEAIEPEAVPETPVDQPFAADAGEEQQLLEQDQLGSETSADEAGADAALPGGIAGGEDAPAPIELEAEIGAEAAPPAGIAEGEAAPASIELEAEIGADEAAADLDATGAGEMTEETEAPAAGEAESAASEAEPPATGEEAAAPAALSSEPNPFFAATLESLEATRSAPLFTPSRTPPVVEAEPEIEVAEPEPEVIAPDPGPPQLQLIGIVRAGREEVAILSDQATGEVQRLSPGAEFQGWTIRIQNTQSVELRKGEATHTLSMFTEYPATGAPPTPQSDEQQLDGFTGEEEMFGDEQAQEYEQLQGYEEPEYDESEEE